MKPAEETIKWVLKFIDMDFAQFREGDWLNLAEDFLHIFSGGMAGKVSHVTLGRYRIYRKTSDIISLT